MENRSTLENETNLSQPIGLDTIYRNVPTFAPYPLILYFSTMLICWVSAGMIVISGVFVAAAPGMSLINLVNYFELII